MKRFQKSIARLFVLPLFVAASVLAPFTSVFDAAAAPGPNNVQVTYNSGTTAFDVSWDGNGADYYGVLVYLDQNTYGFAVPSNEGNSSITGTSRSVTRYTLNEGQTYIPFTPGQAYQLAVYHGNGGVGQGWVPTNITQASSTVSFGTNQSWTSPPASLPRSIVYTNVKYGLTDDFYKRVSWQEPSTTGGSPIIGYQLQFRLTGGDTWDATKVTSGTSFDIDSANVPEIDFRSGYAYQVKIAAINALNSAVSNFAYTTSFVYPQTTRSGTSELPQPTPATLDGDSLVDATARTLEVTTLNGSRDYVTVQSGGILKGTGSATRITVLQGGVLSPGNSPGTITATETYASGGKLQVELLNKDTYDKVVAGTDGQTDSAVGFTAEATLEVILYDGWTIAQGDQFMIVDNRSTQPVNGTIGALTEGSQFTVDGITFSITYVGGDGNDVVLTALNAGTDPTPPNTGAAKLIMSNPAIVAGLGLAAAVALVALAVRKRVTR